METNTYGWVQNPSNFETLKKVVQIFDPTSAHYKALRDELIQNIIYFDEERENLQAKLDGGVCQFSPRELVGTRRDAEGKSSKKRSQAVADSLIQISVHSQKSEKNYSDDWTSQGFLSWAIGFGFLEYDPETSLVSITDTGLRFSKSSLEVKSDPIFHAAISAYPPASRVLEILEEAQFSNSDRKSLNKFEIGSKLGFVGEAGFTSYTSEFMYKALQNEADFKEHQKLRRNTEGTSDKYARMIAGWLSKINFVKTKPVNVSHSTGSVITGFQEYEITAKGLFQLKKNRGNSSHPQIEKYIPWSMLATRGENVNYVRTRRAEIVNYLRSGKSMSRLLKTLHDKGFKDQETAIRFDIRGLNNTGIRIDISANGKTISMKDKVKQIKIPNLNVTEQLVSLKVENQKIKLMEQTDLDTRFYALVDYAYLGADRSRDFEILTMDLLKEFYQLEVEVLGGKDKPDGIAFTNSFGIIVDTKAYRKGYSKQRQQENQMVQYIDERLRPTNTTNPTGWWLQFPSSVAPSSTHFLWVSSYFKGKFSEQLEAVSARTGTRGAAINVENLLLGAHLSQKGIITVDDLASKFENTEINWDKELHILRSSN